MTKGHEKVSALIPENETADAYNMDESGTFTNQIKHFPVDMLKNIKNTWNKLKCSPLLVCTYNDGSDKRGLKLNGKSAKPRSF